jgi:hypothetical protein
MRLVKADALRGWSRLKESRELDSWEYLERGRPADAAALESFVFVSHRWLTPSHPDPDGAQLAELRQRLRALPMPDADRASLLVFYDFCSLPQRPRSADEEAGFCRDLGMLESLSRRAGHFIILSEGYRDYVNRAWCFFEAITARHNVRFFDDQQHIEEELECREFLMGEDLPQVNSYDLEYKVAMGEAEILVAVFQHLGACRVTHADDMPLIKEQLVAHYNRRRLTSFGKLLVGMLRHFEVEFATLPAGSGDEVTACRPFFEHPDWVRLPQLDTHGSFMGGRQGPSLFALPQATCVELGRRHARGFRPLLRLSVPGVRDVRAFLEPFQRDADWETCVVNPVMLGERDDCFPRVDDVVHTVLERPPGFFCSQDGRYLYFPLAG